MDTKIVDFTQHLRKEGVTVSTAELMDALRAIQRLGLSNPRLVKDALRCTLVKRNRDQELFDQVFDRFFFGGRAIVEDIEKRSNAQTRLSEETLRRILERIERLLEKDPGIELSTIAVRLVRGDLRFLWQELNKALAEIARSNQGNAGDSREPIQDLMTLLGAGQIDEELNHLKATAARLSWDDGEKDELERYLQHRLNQLRQLARRLLDGSSQPSGRYRPPVSELSDKPFAHYTEDDVRRMHEAIRRLAQHFRNLLSVRRKRASRGHLDLKRTLRKNLQHGGIPIEIHWDHKRRSKPQVVVLCDISDSVLNASRFMMQVVYSIQELYSKVRSFVFVADIAEVTHLFKDTSIQEAVEAALKGDVINVFEHSNFGQAFRQFHANHLDAINRQTTVIMMGDGRNNYYPANEWALREMRDRAKHLFWLNPERESTWGIGDSEIPRYMEYCDRMMECRNIQQLWGFVELLAR